MPCPHVGTLFHFQKPRAGFDAFVYPRKPCQRRGGHTHSLLAGRCCSKVILWEHPDLRGLPWKHLALKNWQNLRILSLKSSKWPPNLLATLCLQLQMHVGSLSTSHCWQLLHTAQVEPKIVSFVEAEGILKQSFDEQLAHAPVWYILVTLSWRTQGVQGIFSLHRLEQVYPMRSMSLLNPWQTRWDLHGSMPSKDKSEPGECLWNPNGVAAGNTAGYYWWSFWEKGSAWGS